MLFYQFIPPSLFPTVPPTVSVLCVCQFISCLSIHPTLSFPCCVHPLRLFFMSVFLLKWSEVAQSCLTFWDPVDCSPPGSSIHEIFQARVLEWVVISFSRGTSQPRDRTQVSCIVARGFTIWATREVPKCKCFHCYLANKLISIIFLDSIYIYAFIYNIWFSLSELLYSV